MRAYHLLNGVAYVLVTVYCMDLISGVFSAPSDRINYSGTFLRSEEPIPRGCLYQDYRYDHGEMVRTEQPCLNCTCARGVLLCYLRVCPLLASPPPGCFTARKDGDCCPSFICSSDKPSDTSESPEPTTPSIIEENETLPSDDYLQLADEGQREHSVTPTYYSSSVNIPDSSDKDNILNQSSIQNNKESKLELENDELNPTTSFPIATLVPELNNHASNDSSIIVTSTPPSSFLYLEDDFDFHNLNVIKGGCFINGSLYAEGSAIISGSFCEYCYCIRSKPMCIKPKCHLSIDNCRPKYSSEYSCCPTSYSCKKNRTSTTTTTTTTTSEASTVALTKVCEYEGRIYNMGDPVISNVNCQNCFCTEDGVKCKNVECSAVMEGCIPIIPEGHCCPVEYTCDKPNDNVDETFQNNTYESSKVDLDDSSSTIHNVTLEIHEFKEQANETSISKESSIITPSDIEIDTDKTVSPNYKANFITDADLMPSESSPTTIVSLAESDFSGAEKEELSNKSEIISPSTEAESKPTTIYSVVKLSDNSNSTTEYPSLASTSGMEKNSENETNQLVPDIVVNANEDVRNQTHTESYISNSSVSDAETTISYDPQSRNAIEETTDSISASFQTTTFNANIAKTSSPFENEITTAESITQTPFESTLTPIYLGTTLIGGSSHEFTEPVNTTTESIQNLITTERIEIAHPIIQAPNVSVENKSSFVPVIEKVIAAHVVSDMNTESPFDKTSATEVPVVSTTQNTEDEKDLSSTEGAIAKEKTEVHENFKPEYKNVEPDMDSVQSRDDESAPTRENDRLIYFPEVEDALKGFVNFRRRITDNEDGPSSVQPIYKNPSHNSGAPPTKILPKIQIAGNGWKPITEEPGQKQTSTASNKPLYATSARPQNSQSLPGNYGDPHPLLYYGRPLAMMQNKKPIIPGEVPTGPVSYVPAEFDRDHGLQGRISPATETGMPLFSNNPALRQPVFLKHETPEEELEEKSPFGFERRSGLLHEPQSQVLMGRPRTKTDDRKPSLPSKEKVEIITAPSVFDPNSDIDFGRHHLYDHEVKQSRSDPEMRVVSLKQVLQVSPEAAGRPGSVVSVALNGDDGGAYFRPLKDVISKKVDTDGDVIYTGPDDITSNSDSEEPIRRTDPPVKKIVLSPKEPRPFKVIPFLAEDAVGQESNDTRSIFVGPFPTPNPSPSTTQKTVEIKGGKCLSNSRLYENGEMIVKDNPCELCRCFYGRELCQKQTCPEPPSGDCLAEKIVGYCCPRFTCGTQENVESTQTKPLSKPRPEISQVDVPSKIPFRHSTVSTTEISYKQPAVSENVYDRPISANQNSQKENVKLSVLKTGDILESDSNIAPENISPVSTSVKPILTTEPPRRFTTSTIIKLKPTTTTTTTTPVPIKLISTTTQESTSSSKPAPSRSTIQISRPHITKIKITKPVRKPVVPTTTRKPIDDENERNSSSTTVKPLTVSKKPVESDNSVWGQLKVSGCNIFGKFYNLNDFVKDLSGPCNICICSSQGVECTPQC